MGNRANVVIRHSGIEGINIYSHWDGVDLWRSALRGLCGVGQRRIGDPSYLTRIVAEQVIRDCGDNPETGLGIGLTYDDNDQDRVLVIDALSGEVWLAPAGGRPRDAISGALTPVTPTKGRTAEQVEAALGGFED